jgi:hypothetical protein
VGTIISASTRRSAALVSARVLAMAGLLFYGFGPAECRAQKLFRTGEETNYLRQLAKDKPPVLLVPFGPGADEAANAFRLEITQYKDARAKRVEVVKPDQVGREAASKDFGKWSRIFFFVGPQGSEIAKQLPKALIPLLPTDLAEIAKYSTAYRTANLNSRAGDLAFSVLFIAPDAARMKRLTETFDARTFPGYKQMLGAQEAAFESNRVAIFSSEANKQALTGWGASTTVAARRGSLAAPGASSATGGTWDYVDWYPLAARKDMTPEMLGECHEVYFLDRSQADQPVPETAAKALEGAGALTPVSTLIVHSTRPDGHSIVVFSSPINSILLKKAHRYPNVAAAPKLLQEDAIDLRPIRRSALRVYVSGNGADAARDQELNGIQADISADLRTKMSLDLALRGDIFKTLEKEVTFQQLTGATNTAKIVATKTGLRYLWLFEITGYGGTTSYMSGETKLTPDPAPFNQSEPVRPVQGKKEKDGDFQARVNQWVVDHNAWVTGKQQYEREANGGEYQWERQVGCVQRATVRGRLMLIDLIGDDNQAAKVLWQQDGECTSGKNSVVTSERCSVRGMSSRPNSLTAPAPRDDCPPDLLQEAGKQAGDRAVELLVEKALPPGQSSFPVVLKAGDKFATISAGSADGLKKLNYVDIALGVKGERITLRVKTLDEGSADLEPINPVEAQKMSQVTVGMKVDRWYEAPPPAGPQIVAINGKALILSLGARDGARVGDIADVQVSVREIKDPRTGEVLRTIPDIVKLRLTAVDDKSSDASPATASDPSAVAKLQVGQTVVRFVHPAKQPPRPGPGKSTGGKHQ